MATAEVDGEVSPLEQFLNDARAELDQVRRESKEIGLLVEQSQGEVEKLAQRNASITATLHQMQAHFDSVPREDIRSTYEAAQDAQQRLFTMRGQLEKLESDQASLQRLGEMLLRTIQILEGRSEHDVLDFEPRGNSVIERIVEAQEEERRRISRQIHDGPAQALANFILQAEIALRLFDSDAEKAREELNNLKAAAASTFANVRDFIFDLRPMMLDDLGLVPTVRRYIEAFKEKTGLNINVIITGTERRLEVHREVVVFRTIQALLANVREHAQATQVKVSLDMGDHQIRATVEDDGRGFDVESVLEEGEGSQGKGLRMLDERLVQTGGDFDVDSVAGEGTRVGFSLPTGD